MTPSTQPISAPSPEQIDLNQWGENVPYERRLLLILHEALKRHASDVHFVVGLPPMYRIDGELIAAPFPPLNVDDPKSLTYPILHTHQRGEFEKTWQLCVSKFIPRMGHFRVTLYFQQGNVEASIRVCPPSLRGPDELGLPDIVDKVVDKQSGIILITGPTGSGKTTTFNCMIDIINRRRRAKIITVEDPVEFIHDNRLSIIVQQQVGSDTTSFSAALTHILRQDPDVIGVGEMRDLETIATALTAAETGHLVIATLHTPDAPGTIDRIVDAFPGDKQAQILIQLASSLQAVIVQRLLPRLDQDGRVLATEVMTASPAVRNQIRERKTSQLRSTIETSKNLGMHLMDHSLRDLYHRGIISYETAKTYAFAIENIQKTEQA